MKKYASPPGTAGTLTADPIGTYCAHGHHGPGSSAATVGQIGQEGLARCTGAPYGGAA